ncbi:probable disease resistance protein At4g27220 [Herrania umbratica]|uniref:Probable disease resistance protein At4g27220 n=1 Tax=Herrania umbratica TaxID=108875 RepID=A0A6J1AKD9_9ROSI|nr:probable disease resistance protein At4g27220 [Herrania umbratica]
MDIAMNTIVKHCDNHRSLDQNMKNLRRKLKNLNALKEDTESKMRAEMQPRKKLKKQVHLWLGNVERINGEIQNLEQEVEESRAILRGFHTENVLKKKQEVDELLQQGKFDQGLVVDDCTWIGQALATTTLVGKAAENCMEEIWTCLMDDVSEFNLIELWIAEGLVEDMDSQQAEFDEGYTILNKLKNNCLLENGEFTRHVKLHDLVRDMALCITRSRFLVKASLQLKEIPHVQKWTEDLEKVSLMSNYGLRIPSQMSPPKCQMLKTLLLPFCWIESIPDCFFEQMKGLKVLDLSGNNFTILPSSISNLEALTVLLVRGCPYLRKVPSLSKLEALKKLDLKDTAIKNFPHGMERLVNLNYLHLDVKEVPSEILSKFSRLRNLGVSYAFVKGEEIGELKKLEFFEGRLYDLNEYHTFVQALQSRGQGLIRYRMGVGDKKVSSVCQWDKYIELSRCKICRNGVKFPSDLQQLRINYAIVDFPEEEVFFPWFIPTPNGKFSFLKEIDIYRCKNIKKLFTYCWVLSNVQNLEVLRVWRCDQMEEIIALEIEEEGMGSSNSNTIQFSLPKLRILDLCYLPELKSICNASGVMVCDSLEEVHIQDCPNLQRMPLYLPLLDDGQPSPPPSLKTFFISPKEKLTSMEWDHPNAKSVLEPFLKYQRIIRSSRIRF